MKTLIGISLFLFTAGILLFNCSGKPISQGTADSTTLVNFVNPLMGTESSFKFSHGNVYPAVERPWGTECWTPQTGDMGNGWIYQYDHDSIQGIRHTHQPSPWMGDYGAFSFMATTGPLKTGGKERASFFSHDQETSTPYYYSVNLSDYHVTAEVTVSERAAILRFRFPESKEANIIFDAFDKGSSVHYDPASRCFYGYSMNNSGGVPDGFKQYFSGTLSVKPDSFGCWDDKGVYTSETSRSGNHVGAYFKYQTSANELVEIRIGSSFISTRQAERNLAGEIGNKTFEDIRDEGKRSWEDHLDRIRVEEGPDSKKEIFYTCLYRALLFPRKFYEYDSAGDMIHYSPYDGKIHPGLMYADDGFWDTFRAVFPLLTLVYPEEDSKMMKWLVNAYDEGGWLPIWPSPGYRKVMIGTHSASLLADAMVKGIGGFDSLKAFEGVIKDATQKPPAYAPGRDGLEFYNRLGYCPYPQIRESTAKTLEYAYDDFCIRQMALLLGKKKEDSIYYRKAFNYRNVYDPSRKLMQGRKLDGSFLHEFSPLAWGGPFTEGNAWHYTWSVFQDPQGLINLMGGDAQFTQMLDSVFKLPPVIDKGTYSIVIHEFSEMVKGDMGQYAHGNEPIQHMIYLYDYAGEPWKAQYHVREVMNRLYNPGPAGYCGDEDTGQTSAWYVFSAMGFYPVCPGVPQYVLGSPEFGKITIHPENGKAFTILAENNSDNNRYIRSARLNGNAFDRTWLSQKDLTGGGTLTLSMDSIPDKSWGVKPDDRPYSLSNDKIH